MDAVKCTLETETTPALGGIVVAGGFEELFDVMRNHDMFEFYETFMNNFKVRILPANHLNKLLLQKRIVQNIGQEVDYLNTFVGMQMTKTKSGVANYTEIIVGWQSEVYSHAKQIRTGNYFGVFKLVATFLLALERVVAFWHRYVKH